MSGIIRHPEIRSTDECGVEVVDSVERSSIAFAFPTAVELEPASTDGFYFPVETAVSFETTAVECETLRDVHVWSVDGEFVAESTNGKSVSLPADEYLFDVAGPIKTYFRVNAPLQVSSEGRRTSIAFDEARSVSLGIRSLHERPRGTITIDENPYSLLEALSYLGDSLKTLAPDRSFPTMRGHPPRFERGSELKLPDGLSKPDTGIQLQLPPSRRYLYPATTLAYYLGATVVPGGTPQLVADRETFALGTDELSYDRAVSRTLQQVFFLDCLTRTEGLIQAPLYERSRFEARLEASSIGPDSIDFAALYEAPIDERVARYLEIPFELIVEDLPEWRLTADIQPDPEYLEALPYLAADLALIRCREPTPIDGLPETPEPVRDFFRDGTLERDVSFVTLPEAWSVEQTFIGEANPISASKANLESFHNKFDRTETRSDELSVTVVVNDDRMEDELAAVRETYQRIDQTDASVTIVEDATVARLRSILHSDDDFIHYIGHVDRDGLECPDGYLDTTGDGGYSVDAFILNGCQSYLQGEGLIDGGCVAGVVTASKVLNEPAAEVGATFARLLIGGFTISAATTIASDQRLIGNQYLVIGDGSFRIAECENDAPSVCCIEEQNGDEYVISIRTYPVVEMGLGTLITPHISGIEERYISSGKIDDLTVSKEALMEYFELGNVPVSYNGELVWSNDLF